jgi:hypothetical protein
MKTYTYQQSLIAISGIGGHAYGSFKEKGGSHMWLRDSLPQENGLSHAAVITYGFESRVPDSTSFQDLEALASALRNGIYRLRAELVNFFNSFSFIW